MSRRVQKKPFNFQVIGSMLLIINTTSSITPFIFFTSLKKKFVNVINVAISRVNIIKLFFICICIKYDF